MGGRVGHARVAHDPLFTASRRGDAAFVRWANRYERQCNSPDMLRTLMRMILDIDVRAHLPHLQVPALIVHRAGDPAVPVEHGRYLAQHIPGAEYVELPGIDHAPWEGDQDAVVAAIADFVARHA